jgi:hypothetical protein
MMKICLYENVTFVTSENSAHHSYSFPCNLPSIKNPLCTETHVVQGIFQIQRMGSENK